MKKALQQRTAPHRDLTPDEELVLIKKKLQFFTTLKPVRVWLDTKDSYLNSVFGSLQRGIPYGKIIELSGRESHGKTALAIRLAALAQRDGASVVVVDLEFSFDEVWASNLGLDMKRVYVIRPELGQFGKEKGERMITAEEQLLIVQRLLDRLHRKNKDGKIYVLVDSIAAMMTAEDAAAGIQEQNMRTKVSLATFMSTLMRDWVGMIYNYNVMMVFVNQIRVSPGAWGNPEYTPGGNALRFYAAIRVRMSRMGKKILKAGRPMGIRGRLTNWKNKAGGGSREGASAGYKLYYDGRMKFLSADQIKAEGGE